MREQGPQAAKDELCARVYTENKRLKAKFESVTSSQGLSHQLLERCGEYFGVMFSSCFVYDTANNYCFLEVQS